MKTAVEIIEAILTDIIPVINMNMVTGHVDTETDEEWIEENFGPYDKDETIIPDGGFTEFRYLSVYVPDYESFTLFDVDDEDGLIVDENGGKFFLYAIEE